MCSFYLFLCMPQFMHGRTNSTAHVLQLEAMKWNEDGVRGCFRAWASAQAKFMSALMNENYGQPSKYTFNELPDKVNFTSPSNSEHLLRIS